MSYTILFIESLECTAYFLKFTEELNAVTTVPPHPHSVLPNLLIAFRCHIE
jgi:hypothetical protein